MKRRLHVIPIGDLQVHAAQEICWCHPTETEPGIVVHNAKDCREARERALCSPAATDAEINAYKHLEWILIAEYVPPSPPATLQPKNRVSRGRGAGKQGKIAE
jgi:hypothetical protein